MKSQLQQLKPLQHTYTTLQYQLLQNMVENLKPQQWLFNPQQWLFNPQQWLFNPQQQLLRGHNKEAVLTTQSKIVKTTENHSTETTKHSTIVQ